MTPDWFDGERVDRLVFEQVDPVNMEFSRGILDGVLLDGGELSWGYYTDTRVSGSLNVANSNYIEGSRIRIHHYVDAWGYHKELGTFFVGNDDLSYANGQYTGTMSLWSALWALNEEYWSWHYCINQGTYTKAALSKLFSAERPHIIMDSVNDVIYTSTVIYEYGENVLSTAFDVANKCNARLNVDGHGYCVVEPYTPLKNLTPTFTFNFNSKRSLITSDIQITTNRIDAPQRVGVIFKNGDSEIYGSADISTDSPFFIDRRGYRKVNIYTLNDMSPETWDQAEQEAKKRLNEDVQIATEFSFSSLYVPITQGDCVTLAFGDKVYKCLVKNVSHGFGPGLEMTVQLKVV